MDWKVWFARDGVLWQVFFYGGLIATALATVADPVTLGIPASWMPYIRLVAFVAAVIRGKNGMSPVLLARNIGGDK
ncbi:MAG: hypothetical protein KKD01_20250 [Proteobacteria bacterium]|nr:hypothetical protein [Pseudomonadota bacterium]